MAKNHEPDYSLIRNSNKIINVVSNVKKLFSFLSETTGLSANIYHPLNTTEQYQGNAERSLVGLNVGNIYKGLKSLNSTLFNLIRIQNEEYGQGNNDTESVYDQDTAKHSSAIFTFELVVNLFAIPIVAFIGCMLSTVGICYLLNGSRRTKIQNMLLSTLFSFDGLILFFMFLRGIGYTMRSILSTYSVSCHILVSFAIRYFEISSIFTLVSLSHARLSAIRKPFLFSNILLTWQERKKNMEKLSYSSNHIIIDSSSSSALGIWISRWRQINHKSFFCSTSYVVFYILCWRIELGNHRDITYGMPSIPLVSHQTRANEG